MRFDMRKTCVTTQQVDADRHTEDMCKPTASSCRRKLRTNARLIIACFVFRRLGRFADQRLRRLHPSI